jgi:probable selenium-dependent hydroxylase accessory protein YqeC
MEEAPPPRPALYTTTTKICPPHPHDGLFILSSNNKSYLKMAVESITQRSFEMTWRMVITGAYAAPGKYGSISPEFASELGPDHFSIILNEADGARSMSIKVPREGEPVLMKGARYLVPVIGLDCLGKPLGPELIFRWQIAQEKYFLEAGRIMTPELAAFLLMNPEGVCKGWRPEMEIVPYINKVDDEDQDPLAQKLAYCLLHNGNFPVKRVVWGSLQGNRAGLFAD